jgi:hypothetical protein
MTRRTILIVVLCSLVTLTGTVTWLQSSEPKAVSRRSDDAVERLNERVLSLEGQVAALNKALQDLSQTTARAARNTPLSYEPSSDYVPRKYDPPRAYEPRKVDSDPPRGTTLQLPPSREPVAPPPPVMVVPKHWQRLEINGQAFYVIPVNQFQATPADIERNGVTEPSDRTN